MPISSEKYLILFSSELELIENNIIIMKNLIIDAAKIKFFLRTLLIEILYTCSHENSKINFEKLITF